MAMSWLPYPLGWRESTQGGSSSARCAVCGRPCDTSARFGPLLSVCPGEPSFAGDGLAPGHRCWEVGPWGSRRPSGSTLPGPCGLTPMSSITVCERHGLSYDADQQSSCPECRKAVEGPPPAGPRSRPLDSRRLDPGKPASSRREATTTRRPEGRTTARGPRSASGKPRPPFVPVVRRSSRPPNNRVHGLMALGWLGLMGFLAYRHWGSPADGSAAGSSGHSAPAVDTREAETAPAHSSSTAPRERASSAEEPAREPEPGSAAARRWPAIRYRGRAGELPEICRVPWLEMYDHHRLAALADGQQAQRQTPLMVAAESGSLDSLQLLLSQGLEVDGRDSLNHTALMYAAAQGRTAHVQALLRAGADGRTRGAW